MPLLYRGLRQLLRLALELYYVDVETTGGERVPRNGPLILAANHPNSIMDAVVLGTQVKRPISYLARSGLFHNPGVAALFHSAGVIPVYRRQDGPTPDGANTDAFSACHELLGKGGAIGIFPEGRNAPERHVREIKTGVARIALGAEAAHGFALGVRVVPVGLNFQDRDGFLTRVLVRFAEPIDASAYREAWEQDEREAVRQLTERIQQCMREAAVHIEDERNTQLVRDVNDIYGGRMLERATGSTRGSLDDWFATKQTIADTMERAERSEPDLVAQLRRRVRKYREHLAQVSLRRDFLDKPPATLSARREAVKMTLYALLLAPAAMWGLVHNFVPYRIARRMALGAPDEAMRAIRALVTGTLLFVTAYVLYGWAIATASGSVWWALGYLITLPPAGLFYLRWRRQIARYADRIVVRTLSLEDKKLLRRLALEREQLLMEIEQVCQRYGGIGAAEDVRLRQPPSAPAGPD